MDYMSEMRLALFQPEIPGNVGAVLRTAACFGVPVDLIEPMGFPWDDRRVRRAAMDYGGLAEVARHADWTAFAQSVAPRRLVVLAARGAVPLPDAAFRADDVLLMGSESAGLPPHAHAAAALRVRIPIRPGLRSLNLSVAAAIALAEALRQTNGWPG
jgi:tRNA (cytidine/uridine-2'-O-)-methyltransferase